MEDLGSYTARIFVKFYIEDFCKICRAVQVSLKWVKTTDVLHGNVLTFMFLVSRYLQDSYKKHGRARKPEGYANYLNLMWCQIRDVPCRVFTGNVRTRHRVTLFIHFLSSSI
jgi:hypothetical protein